MEATKTIGLTLSGGGARGAAHIGLLKALEEHLIFPQIISGASAGSIVGALYAAGLHPDKILEFAEESSLYKTFQIGLPTKGLADLQYLKEQLLRYIGYDSFEQLGKKFFVSVTNLEAGRAELLSSGSLSDAVKASCSIPLVFRPTLINEQTYVDGGLMNNFPTHCIRPQCDILIGMNVMPHAKLPTDEVKSVIDIAIRSFELSVWNNTIGQVEHCDFYIEPEALRKYHLFKFSKSREIHDIGYEAGMQVVPDLLRQIL